MHPSSTPDGLVPVRASVLRARRRWSRCFWTAKATTNEPRKSASVSLKYALAVALEPNTPNNRTSDVFTIPMFHKTVALLVGPEVTAQFFKGTDLQMSQKEVYQFNVPTFGRGVVFDVDHTVRREQFRWFADALKPNRLRTYVDKMLDEAEDFFGKWGDEGELDLNKELATLLIMTASRCLLGKEVRETMFERVSSLFLDMTGGERNLRRYSGPGARTAHEGASPGAVGIPAPRS